MRRMGPMGRMLASVGVLGLMLWLALPAKAPPPFIYIGSSTPSMPETVPLWFVGVRQAYTNWTGASMTVAADITTPPYDSYTRDIEFVNGWADTNAVVEFITTNGTGRAFCTKLYDQTGHTNHCSFGAGVSGYQGSPLVYENGALVLQAGRLALASISTEDPPLTMHVNSILLCEVTDPDPLLPLGYLMSNDTFTVYTVAVGLQDSGYPTVVYGGNTVIYGNLGATSEWGTYNGIEVASGAGFSVHGLRLVNSRAYDDVDLYTRPPYGMVNRVNGTTYNYRGDGDVHLFAQGSQVNEFTGYFQEAGYWTNALSNADVLRLIKNVGGRYGLAQ